jgi:predicted Kef-type K+ transport protein
MIALIIGIILLAFGVWSVLPYGFPMGLNWGPQVVQFLMGGAPILAFLIGIIALFIGIADIKDKIDAKKEEKSASAETKTEEKK